MPISVQDTMPAKDESFNKDPKVDNIQKGLEGSVDNAQEKILSLLQGGKPGGKPSDDASQPEEVAEPENQLQAEPETEVAEEAPTTEDPVTWFDELSDHLGVDGDYLLSLKVNAKVNGQDRTPTIKDLLANYQKGESAEMRLMEAADVRKKFESEQTAEREKLSTEWQRVQAITQELENLWNEDDRQLDVLRQADPAEWAARVQDKQLRLQRAERVRQQLMMENQQQRNDVYLREVSVERPKLLSSIPEWNDERVQQAEAVKVRQYLLDNGYSESEIDGQFNGNNVVNPGLYRAKDVVLARKAMLYDESIKGSAPKKEKLKTLPKVGTGKRISKSDVETGKVQEARAKLKATGTLNDAAAAIFNTINRGASK